MLNINCSIGGSVLIAVDVYLKSKSLKVSINCGKHIFVSIHFDNTYHILSCVYKPPRLPIDKYKLITLFRDTVSELFNATHKAKIIILGDFNPPSLVSSSNTLHISCSSQI